MQETKYQPAEIEARIHAAWEKADAFKAGRPDLSPEKRAKAEPYCIVIPPPNVTGSLHMGHALNNTLQDVLCRFERMRGKDVLWQPGTDHAGIATQLVVARQLAEKQIHYKDLGRKKFLEKVWEWKAESGGTIVNQLKRLGASCDWSRERFTMDEGLSKAVLKVFVDLYNQGLIYKDKRLVNWDPEFQSAVSDLEVEPREHTGSFKWARDQKDKDGNPVPFDAAKLDKILDKDPSGHMYYITYEIVDAPIAGGGQPKAQKQFVMVATTRPETMLGDTGVAIHPENEKLKHLIGKTCVLPLVGRNIPIVGDEYADPEKGTGAVKITPAHDFNDWDVGKRAKLEVINILDARGRIIANDDFSDEDSRHPDTNLSPTNILRIFGSSVYKTIPTELRGLDRFEARKRIVAMLHDAGALEKIEPNTHAAPHAQRGDAIIEPWLTDQWYADAATLAKPALAAVKDGRTRFVPEKYAADYQRWLDNIQPWCISRQLWWGHQIPAWYGPALINGKIAVQDIPLKNPKTFVGLTEQDVRVEAEEFYGQKIEFRNSDDPFDIDKMFGSDIVILTRDPDVLDTWFSSALWPFSTLGWPDATPEVKRYYPTACLVTGFDIIFFWVARMMMQGVHFMGEVPFRDVYIHGLVRDAKGRKMSKSIGNVIDPLKLIDQYGADALRFTLAALATQGRDVKLDDSRVEGYRNFATKLWNATRFAEMNECRRVEGIDPKSAKLTVNRWIAGETERAAAAVTTAIEAYKFNEAATAAYEFGWGTFCDWYVELTKPILAGSDEAAKAETRAMTAWVLDQTLAMLHPFMPFITEELWQKTGVNGPHRESLLALAPWPDLHGLADKAADDEIGWLVKLISDIRSVRSEMNVPAGAKVPLVLVGASKTSAERAGKHQPTIMRMARIASIDYSVVAPKGSAQVIVGEMTVALPLAGIIDMAAEKKRIAKEIDKVMAEIKKVTDRLGNPKFMTNAPDEVVEELRERQVDWEQKGSRLKAAFSRIEAD